MTGMPCDGKTRRPCKECGLSRKSAGGLHRRKSRGRVSELQADTTITPRRTHTHRAGGLRKVCDGVLDQEKEEEFC